jgi:glutamine amidotransferase
VCSQSEEDDTTGLGISDLQVKKFRSDDKNFKVPQIGWNTLENYNSPLLDNVEENTYVYYVHSYYATIGSATSATSNYIVPYSAMIHKNNFYGVQFHTEKSAAVGEKILLNFLNLK